MNKYCKALELDKVLLRLVDFLLLLIDRKSVV